jgi:opacity protein-like surface antigen
MGSLKTLAVAGVVVLGVSATAFAADLPPPPVLEPAAPKALSVGGGWYLRGDIGIGTNRHEPDIEFTSNGGPVPLGAGATFIVDDFKMGSSPFFGVGIGYQFNSWLRADLTAEYRGSASLQGRDTFLFPATATTGNRLTNNYSGSIQTNLFLANIYADLGTFCGFGCITPFVGAGLGFASHKVSQITDYSVRGPYNTASAPTSVFTGGTFAFNTYFAEKTKTNFAWALMAGLGVDVTKNVKLELGYRYVNMGKAESGPAELSGLADNPANLQVKFKDLDSHDFRMGMRWLLNADCCAAPVAYTPPPAPMVRKF